MKSFKILFSITLSLTLFVGSLALSANENICNNVFAEASLQTIKVKDPVTVEEHFLKFGILKSDQEITRLIPEDQFLYHSLLDLEFERAQEIIRLFATYPILTSEPVLDVVKDSFQNSGFFTQKQYLKKLDQTKRQELSKRIAQKIVQSLTVNHVHLRFILKDDLSKLSSEEKILLLNVQKRKIAKFGLPETLVKEVAEFFSPIEKNDRYFKLIHALVYQNFEKIAMVSSSGIDENLRSTANFMQVTGMFAAKAAGIFLGVRYGLDTQLPIFDTIGTFTVSTVMMGLLNNNSRAFQDFTQKIAITKWIDDSRRKFAVKREGSEIRQGLLALSGLDPSSIKPLPTIEVLEKLPSSKQTLSLLPALTDAERIANPEVDLVLLENAFEKKISLSEIRNLSPKFDNIESLSENPFHLLSFGKELDSVQFFVIGREELLTEQFRQFTERLNNWQNKRVIAKTDKEKAQIIDEKIRLTELLHHHIEENSQSWLYLTELQKALEKYDDFLRDVIKPRLGQTENQVATLQESFAMSLLQISLKKKSLNDRSESLSKLLSALRI